MSCSQKTSNGNKEMIIFIIAKQFKQLTLACKSKNINISLYICTFRKISKTNTKLLIDAKQEWFSRLKSAWIPSVHDNRSKKRAAGEPFSYKFL